MTKFELPVFRKEWDASQVAHNRSEREASLLKRLMRLLAAGKVTASEVFNASEVVAGKR